MQAPTQEYLSLSEIAVLFGVSLSTICRRAQRKGAPQSFKIGRRRYIRMDEALASLVLRLP